MNIDIKKLEDSQVEIKVILPSKELEKHRDKVTDEAIKKVKVDGFREGKVPKEMALSKLNPLQILEQMAHIAISEKYVEIINNKDIKAIGHPHISITKIAEGLDLEFTIITAVLPEISLPDYKKIAKNINKDTQESRVDDKELDEALMNLRKMRAQQEMLEDKKNKDKGENISQEPVSLGDIDEKQLPEMDDTWAKDIGPFEGLEDLKAKMKDNLLAEKQSKDLEKKRMAILDGILESSKIDVPSMMVDYELQKMISEFEHSITMTGMSFDEYLESIKKTREDYKKEWQDQAKKRAQIQLMINDIADKENLEPGDEEMEAEVLKIMDQYKNQKAIDEQSVRAYVASILTNQKVFEFLESQK